MIRTLIRKSFLTFLCLWILVSPGYASEKTEDTFRQASILMEQHKYNQALTLFDTILKEDPNHQDSLKGAFKAAHLTGQIDRATDYVESLKSKASGLEALWLREVQFEMYYKATRLKEADRIRKEMVELWKTSTDPDIKKRPGFVREVIPFKGKNSINCIEDFEFSGPWAKRYVFVLQGPQFKNPRYVSLGSYEATNQFVRSTEHKPSDWRLYHLDAYEPSGMHATLGMWMDGEPPYETARDMAIAYFKGKLKPTSSSMPSRN